MPLFRRTTRPQHDPQFGSDSFLDIVSNIVGIVIVLVMLAGLRVKESLRHAAEAPQQAAAAEVRRLSTESASLERDVYRLAAEAMQLSAISAARLKERDELLYLQAAVDRELAERRAKLADDERAQYDLRRALDEARAKLDQRQAELAQVGPEAEGPPIEVPTYPTPISRTVHGRELHFQLKNGRVAYVPLEEFITQIKAQVRAQAYKLRDTTELTDTAGPVDGFRMRYTMERVDVPVATNVDPQSGANVQTIGSYVRLVEFRLLPASDRLGETLPQALDSRSQFRTALTDVNPRETVVTLWTYPDSFELYRELKQQLYLLGFQVAGRPMPEGRPIAGSPQGTKSSAQ